MSCQPNGSSSGTIDAPDAPICIPRLVEEARFALDGFSINVVTASETNGNQLFPTHQQQNCQNIFDSESRTLLGGSTCRFTTPNDLEIRLVDTDIEPNTTLRFNESTSLKRGTTALVASTQVIDDSELVDIVNESFEVAMPVVTDADLVSPQIVAPSRVIPCDDSLIVDVSATYASLGGRDGVYEWSATPEECVIVSESGRFAQLDLSSVTPRDSCQIQLRVTNYLGIASKLATANVLRGDLNVPPVTFQSSEASPWTRDEGYSLTADVGTIGCVGGYAINGDLILYSWTLVIDATNSPFYLESSNQSTVFVESYILEVGVTYRFDVIVSYDSTVPPFQPFGESFVVEIEDAVLSAVITSSRSGDDLQVRDEFELAVGLPLQFSAASSSDGNIGPNDRVPGNHFAYAWSCSRVPFDGALAEFVPSSTRHDWGDCNLPSAIDVASVDFLAPGGTFSNATAYRLTLSVEANGLQGTRRSSQEVFFLATERPGPAVSIDISDPATGNRILETDTLRLQGLAISELPIVEYTWLELSEGITSHDDILEYVNTPLDGPTLSLDPGLLTFGNQYRFQLTAVDSENGRGSAIVTVDVVQGPTISSFTIVSSRSSADADAPFVEVDTFRLEVVASVGQRDDLEYQFSYYFEGSSLEEAIVVTNFQSQPVAEVNLPAGNLILLAVVASESGFTSRRELSVTIEDAPNACESFGKTRDRLAAEVGFRDTDNAFHSAFILARALMREDVRQCSDVDIDATRNFLFDTMDLIWSFQNFHSATQAAQMAQCVRELSEDAEYFTLTQIDESLSWVVVAFDAIDVALAQNLQSAGIDVGTSISYILSNTLGADVVQEKPSGDDARIFCKVVTEIQLQLQRLLSSAVAELLVDEEGTDIDQATIVAQAIRAAVGQGETIEVEGASLEIIIESSNADRSASVSFSSYDGVISQCFPTGEEAELASSIIDIDILECETQNGASPQLADPDNDECVFSVGNVSFRLETTSQLSSACLDTNMRAAEEFQCSFWHEDDQIWSTEGCNTVHTTNDPTQVRCVCSHLTTFSVLKSLRTIEDPNCFRYSTNAALGASVAYGLLTAIALFQITRLNVFHSNFSFRRAVFTHVCIALAALSRFGFIVSLAWSIDVTFLQALAAISLGLQFGVFALIVQQWAAIYHGMFQQANKDRNLRILKLAFSIFSFVIGLLFLGVVGVFAAADSNSASFATAAQVGSLGMSIVSLLSAICFGVYGSLLIQVVMKSYHNVKGSNTKSKSTKKSAERILVFMMLFVISFISETVINVVSIAVEELFTLQFTAFQSAYIFFNVLTYVLVLRLSDSMVVSERSVYKSSRPFSAGSGSQSHDLIEHRRLTSQNNSQSNIASTSTPQSPRTGPSFKSQRPRALNRAYTESRSGYAPPYERDNFSAGGSGPRVGGRKEHERSHSVADAYNPSNGVGGGGGGVAAAAGGPRTSPAMNGRRAVPGSPMKRGRSQSTHNAAMYGSNM